MDRETARQTIKQQIPCKNYLEKSKSGNYCCPFCDSGHKEHGTGALKVYEKSNTFHCFAAKCGKTGDVIDLKMKIDGIDYNTALSLLAEEIGITIDRYSPENTEKSGGEQKTDITERHRSNESGQKGIKPLPETNAQNEALERTTESHADFIEYYQICRKRLHDPAAAAYLKKRGISLATAEAYWIGFDPEADPANAPGAMGNENKPHPCARLIIPTSREHYIGRRIDGKTEFAKLNPAGSTPAIFNANILFTQEVQEIFVAEGAFDALSIIEAGSPAIALNSTENAGKLLQLLEQRRTKATLILCPDSDKDPKTADRVKAKFAELSEGLQQLNISTITADVNGHCKDANAHLMEDREAFFEAVEKARRQAAAKPDNTAYYIKNIMAKEIARFKGEKKTGFTNLDAEAGGLYAGLYVLAAVTSLGKTTFALQLAEQLAAGGEDVIFFSLEQSRLELVSKCIARRTAQKDMAKAATSLAIRKGYSTPEVKQAIADHEKEVANRLNIVEGNFSCDTSFIGDYIRRYTKRNKTRPVVFIDYLQILQPEEEAKRQGTREVVDNTVTALKRLSRELDLTIFIISSVNRSNYLTPIDFESLKESGGIEFTCDVVFGLQLQCLNDDLFNKETKIKEKREAIRKAKAENPRKIELICLKNRYGVPNYSCYFEYFPQYDLFKESKAPADSKPMKVY